MKILNTQQLRAWDDYTIANEPILSIDLMERASRKIFSWIHEHYSTDESFIVFAGSGNNGGDALALTRILYNAGYVNLKLYLLKVTKEVSMDCYTNLNRLRAVKNVEIIELEEGANFPEILSSSIIIDGIFGSGLSRPVLGYWGRLISYINENALEIISIDNPSGLFGEDNSENSGSIIKATITLTFQFPNVAFFFADNEAYFGRWFVLDIGLHPDYLNDITAKHHLVQKEYLRDFIKERRTFDHKGTYGHAFLVAGSYMKTGAAVLAAKACLRSGVGLLTVHVPETGREIIQTAVPEAMVCIDETEMNYCQAHLLSNYSALGVGPGIGKKQSMQNALKRLLENNSKPIVLDADALNILAEKQDWLNLLPKDAILTPHPGEFDRLTQKYQNSFDRYKSQLDFSKKYGVIVVLKGAFTSITDPEGNVFFNSNGNPGMATAGSGDVLTGIILSLLAQGYKPIVAAKLGVFVHGLSGDLAKEKYGMEALIASDIIKYLGAAFSKLKKD